MVGEPQSNAAPILIRRGWFGGGLGGAPNPIGPPLPFCPSPAGGPASGPDDTVACCRAYRLPVHAFGPAVGIILTSEFRQLGARLHPNQRGAVGTKVTVAVSLPSTAVGNEIQVTLPKGLFAWGPWHEGGGLGVGSSAFRSPAHPPRRCAFGYPRLRPGACAGADLPRSAGTAPGIGGAGGAPLIGATGAVKGGHFDRFRTLTPLFWGRCPISPFPNTSPCQSNGTCCFCRISGFHCRSCKAGVGYEFGVLMEGVRIPSDVGEGQCVIVGNVAMAVG